MANGAETQGTLIESGANFLDSFLPDPNQVWQKYQTIKQKQSRASVDKIAHDLIFQTALKTGTVGAVTSFGGLITLIFLLPVDMVISTRLESELVYLLAFAHGLEPDDPDLRMMVYWILAGETAKSAGRVTAKIAVENLASSKAVDTAVAGGKEVLFEGGIEVAKGVKNAAQKTSKNVSRKIGRKAVHKASHNAARKGGAKIGLKIIPKGIAKIFPLVGAVIGAIVNFTASQNIGNLAHRWFQEIDQYYAEIERVIPPSEAGAKSQGNAPASTPVSATTSGSAYE